MGDYAKVTLATAGERKTIVEYFQERCTDYYEEGLGFFAEKPPRYTEELSALKRQVEQSTLHAVHAQLGTCFILTVDDTEPQNSLPICPGEHVFVQAHGQKPTRRIPNPWVIVPEGDEPAQSEPIL
jgi:hypothetical protein